MRVSPDSFFSWLVSRFIACIPTPGRIPGVSLYHGGGKLASYKRDVYMRALYDGATPEEAAAEAGYTPAYGRQLAAQPDVLRALERRKAYEAARVRDVEDGQPDTPVAVLEQMAYDAGLDPRVRIQAIRVLAMLADRDAEEHIEPVTIVDDLGCVDCPRREAAKRE